MTSSIDAVTEGIRDLIFSGQLGPGSRLPPEGALAEQFQLSRNTVREGVRALVTARVLTVRQGDGTFVTTLEPGLLLEGIGFAVDMMRDDSVLDLIETRRMIESEAVALTADRVTPSQLLRIERCLASMEEAADHAEFVRLDAEFHDLINLASGNPVLAAIIRGVSRPSLRARVWRDILEAGASERTIREHRRILSALVAHDPSEARKAAADHVRTTEAWLHDFRRPPSAAHATPTPPPDALRPIS